MDEELKATEKKKGAPKVADSLEVIIKNIDELQKTMSVLVADVAKVKTLVGFNDRPVELPKTRNNNPDILPVGGVSKTLAELGRNNRS